MHTQEQIKAPEVSTPGVPPLQVNGKDTDAVANANVNEGNNVEEKQKEDVVVNGVHSEGNPSQSQINNNNDDERLKFIATTDKISNDLKIPLIIESTSNEFGKTNDFENHSFVTTITNSSHDGITITENSSNKEVSNTKKNTVELVFKVEEDAVDIVFKPFIFGSSFEEFLDQKKRFTKDGEEDEDSEAALESKDEEIKEEAVKSTPFQWAAIAQIGADKQPKQSINNTSKNSSSSTITATSTITTSTSTTTTSTLKKEDLKLIPTVSNVLEPLGSVVLKLMFDKSFQNYYTSTASKSKIPKIIPRGLVNTGNICFMSSIIQVLLYCKPFYETLNVISNKTIQSLSSGSKTPLFESIISLYKDFNYDTNNNNSSSSTKKKFGDSITPTEFYKSISSNERFSHLKWGHQEDAEEFFGYLIDGLHEEFILSISQLKQHDVKTLLNSIVDDEQRSIIKNELKKYSTNNNDDDDNNDNSNETNNNNDNNDTHKRKTDIVSDDGWKEVGSKSSKVSTKRTVEIKKSPITHLFGGSFRSVLNVPKQKESQSITLDPFQQIQLDISSDDVETLEDAFKKISEIEEIPSYKLKNGLEVTAKKQTFIDRLPEVLVIHLKRFSFTNSSSSSDYSASQSDSTKEKSPSLSASSSSSAFSSLGFGKVEKISKKIQFNHDLKIPDELISSTTKKFNANYSNELNYKLIGVVYHIGKNSDGGHYTVDVQQENNQWLSIDDTLITELKPEEVLNGNGHDENVKTAYILMYQRV